MELMQAKQQDQLSKDADKKRYALMYTYDRQQLTQSLSVDLSNARKPGPDPDRQNAVRIIQFMRQNKLDSVRDFVDFLTAKWKDITEKNLTLNTIQEIDSTADDIQDPPPMPDISGLQLGQTKNLGDGFKITMAADGNIHYTGGFGKVVYSPQGKPLSYDSPNFAGLVKKQDFSTGNTTTSYAAGPLNVSQTKNAQGQTIGSKGSYNVGNESVNADQAYKNGQPTIQTRTQTGITADDNLVKNQDTLISARQVRPTAEDQQLEAMLRIAGLR
jgi:hypothetical protein